MAGFSKTVSAGARLYYFDVRHDKNGSAYLSIAEMNKRNKRRNCVYVYPEDIDRFTQAVAQAATHMDKAAENT